MGRSDAAIPPRAAACRSPCSPPYCNAAKATRKPSTCWPVTDTPRERASRPTSSSVTSSLSCWRASTASSTCWPGAAPRAASAPRVTSPRSSEVAMRVSPTWAAAPAWVVHADTDRPAARARPSAAAARRRFTARPYRAAPRSRRDGRGGRGGGRLRVADDRVEQVGGPPHDCPVTQRRGAEPTGLGGHRDEHGAHRGLDDRTLVQPLEPQGLALPQRQRREPHEPALHGHLRQAVAAGEHTERGDREEVVHYLRRRAVPVGQLRAHLGDVAVGGFGDAPGGVQP